MTTTDDTDHTDTEQTPATDAGPTEATTAEEQPEDGSRPSREAATYRRRLRDTETERDGLRSTVEAMQRSEVERLAADQLAQPAAIWKAEGVELQAMLDDDGRVDPGKVTAAIADAKAALGLAGPASPSPDGGARTSVPLPGTTWSAALDPKQQRRRW